VDRTLLAVATELAGRRGLRAADATRAPGFVCLDHELNTAAAAEGLTCLV
jgi:hypothetical protein